MMSPSSLPNSCLIQALHNAYQTSKTSLISRMGLRSLTNRGEIMSNQVKANQNCVSATSNVQCVAAGTMSVCDAMRHIQATVTGAAEGAYPSEWLFASVGGN
jgi:hypothetical protein